MATANRESLDRLRLGQYIKPLLLRPHGRSQEPSSPARLKHGLAQLQVVLDIQQFGSPWSKRDKCFTCARLSGD
jgi:hypothetical protein